MLPLGTLNVAPKPNELNLTSLDKYNSYKVNVHVKRPDPYFIWLLGKITTIFSIFEMVLTAMVICLSWSPLCFLFIIPLIFRVAALPRKFFRFHESPLFVLTHSLIIGIQSIVMFGFTYFYAQTLLWSDDNGFLCVFFGCISLLLFVRYILTLFQYRQANRVFMNRVLDNPNYIYTVHDI